MTLKLLAQETLAECPNVRGKYVSGSAANLHPDLASSSSVALKLPGEVYPWLRLGVGLGLGLG